MPYMLTSCGRRVAVALEPGAQGLEVKCFATEDHQAQGEVARSARLLGADELAEGRRRLVEDSDPSRASKASKAAGERLTQKGTMTSRPPYRSAPHSSQTEKSKAMEWNSVQTSALVESGTRRRWRANRRDDIGVGDHHALGPAGRAGSVDDVSGVAGSGGRRKVAGIVARGVVLQEQGLRRGPFGARGKTALGEHHRGGGVGQHEDGAVVGICRVDGDVGRAGLEDSQDTGDQDVRALGEQAHVAPGPTPRLRSRCARRLAQAFRAA